MPTALSGVPLQLPGAPSLVSAEAGNRLASLTWTAPSETGFGPLTAYQIYYGISATPDHLFGSVGGATADGGGHGPRAWHPLLFRREGGQRRWRRTAVECHDRHTLFGARRSDAADRDRWGAQYHTHLDGALLHRTPRHPRLSRPVRYIHTGSAVRGGPSGIHAQYRCDRSAAWHRLCLCGESHQRSRGRETSPT